MSALAIDPNTQSGLLDHFIAALTLTFREMTASEPLVRGSYRASSCRALGDVSAVLALKAQTPLVLVLSFPDQTAASVAARVLAEVENQPGDTMLRDCLGEMANVTAGQAKALLHGSAHAIELTTPVVLAGAGREAGFPQGQDCFVVEFDSELGEFALQLVRGNNLPKNASGA